MLNIFRSAPPLATQLGTMISFANSSTPAQIAKTWPSVLGHVVRPAGVLNDPSETLVTPLQDDEHADSFRGIIVGEFRSYMDARVMKFFREHPSERKLRRGGFENNDNIVDLAKSAFDSRVISPASSAYMLEAAMRMQDGNGGNSELPVGLKIAEAAVITGVACYAEYMIYDIADDAIAKYSMMTLLGAATVYYIINRISDIVKNH